MATIAIGDIHGFLPPLTVLLSRILEVATPAHTVVFLHDYGGGAHTTLVRFLYPERLFS
jgi:hypothetical protein